MTHRRAIPANGHFLALFVQGAKNPEFALDSVGAGLRVFVRDHRRHHDVEAPFRQSLLVPIEDRVEWVKTMLARVEQINAARADGSAVTGPTPARRSAT